MVRAEARGNDQPDGRGYSWVTVSVVIGVVAIVSWFLNENRMAILDWLLNEFLGFNSL